MYKKIIVPLDGSKLAEEVLPHLKQIALGCGVSEVILVTVTQRIKGKTDIAAGVDDLSPSNLGLTVFAADRFYAGKAFTTNPSVKVSVSIGKMAKTGYDYLVKIAKQLEKQDIPSSVVVLIGNVADEVVSFAKQENADLIIMASKGRTSLKKWDVGNAADQVFKMVENIPILLVKPPYGFLETKPVRKGKAT